MNYEIRIFANPAGFEEMSLNTVGKYSLFPQDVVSKRNFDGERGQLPNGTFSVYYTPDAYIIAYHFLLSSDAQFRDREAHIAVAIQRGFKMIEPTATFQELANEFVRIAIEYKSSAANKIYNNSEKFYSIVSARIVEDSMQFKFNTTYSVAKRAIIAVESPKERDIILGDPFRKELKDINILYIINFEDGSRVRQLTSIGYKPITNLKFPYSRSYTLVYPDGHRVEFTDLSQELPEYTVHRQYEKPLSFLGSVEANWEKWKVSASEDKTEYRIGILPEKEKKTFKVIAFDQNGREINSSRISAKTGHYIDGQWTLEGEEIIQVVKKDVKDLFSIVGYSINAPLIEIDESTLCINACMKYSYDLSELFKFLNEALGPNATVVICSRSSNKKSLINKSKERFDLEYPYSDIYVQVPETATTEEMDLEFDAFGKVYSRSLRKKKLGEITFLFGSNLPNDIKKKLSHNEQVGKIVCKYQGYNGPDKKEYGISDHSVRLTDLPRSQVLVKVEVDGYDVLLDENKIDLKQKSTQKIVCDLKPTTITWIKQCSKRHLPTFVVGTIVGVLLGLWIANMWNFLPSSRAMLKHIEALRKDSTEFQTRINRLNYPIGDLQRQPQVVQENNNKSSEPEVQTSLNNQESAADKEQELIAKLEGVEFTMDDVKEASRTLSKECKGLIGDADACLEILELTPSQKEQLGSSDSEVYKNIVNKLTIHKDIMQAIIEDEAYKTCTEKNIKTIKQMQDYLSQQQGGSK